MLLYVVFGVVVILLFSLQKKMIQMFDLFLFIKYVYYGMMFIELDIVKLDQDLIKIMKVYWFNILFYSIEYGLYIVRDIIEFIVIVGIVVDFWGKVFRVYVCVFSFCFSRLSFFVVFLLGSGILDLMLLNMSRYFEGGFY